MVALRCTQGNRVKNNKNLSLLVLSCFRDCLSWVHAFFIMVSPLFLAVRYQLPACESPYMFDRRNNYTRLIGILLVSTFIGCSNSSPIQTPKMIGEKERTGILSGKQAAVVVNKLHGRVVAADANVIAEYGREKKELLYITRYKDEKEAAESLDLMVSKIAAAENGPFFQPVPLSKYENNAYMTLGMGAVHYIYISGNSLLWLQSYQSFGTSLPPRLLDIYPVNTHVKQ